MTSTIVVGMSGSTGLGVVRALAGQGVTCQAVHYDDWAPPMATRLATTHVAPDWRIDPEALPDLLVELAGRIGTQGDGPVASLFVCHDAALQPVWAAGERLRAAGLRPAFSSSRPLSELLDKRTQLTAAERAGVDAPWTRWGPAAELAEFADVCPYPVILKPATSHLGVRALGAKALRCSTPDELLAALRRVPDIEVLLQEYVPGGDDHLYTVGVFVCRDGHLAFTGRKLKQHPPHLGIARLAEAVDEPELVPGSVALLAELGYEGISQVEYKRDDRDGSYRLMEANLRPWTWMGLATACGVNLPLAAHHWALSEGERQPVDAFATAGVPRRPARWIWLVPEVNYTLYGLRHGKPPDLSQWRGIRTEAFYSPNDPRPLLRTLAGAWRSRRRRRARRRAEARRTAHAPAKEDSGADGRPSRRAGGLTRHRRGGGLTRPPRAAFRAVRRAVGRASMLPAAIANGAVLRAEWRCAGRRSVAGNRPDIGLPQPGSTLVLAPHPDDETIMCGATLALLRARGDQVRVVAVTAGAATRVLHGGAADRAGGASDIAALRRVEAREACAALGVDDLHVWEFGDGRLALEREALARRISEELQALRPAVVVAPLPYDAHDDHVALAVALADALSGLDDGPLVLCGAVRTPFSASWPTRLVPAGEGWKARRAAIRSYRSRGRSIFRTPGLLAWLHPAHPLRAVEGYVELSPEGYVEFVRAMEQRGLTKPGMRGGGHPFFIASRMVRTRRERGEVAALLGRAVRPCLRPASTRADE